QSFVRSKGAALTFIACPIRRYKLGSNGGQSTKLIGRPGDAVTVSTTKTNQTKDCSRTLLGRRYSNAWGRCIMVEIVLAFGATVLVAAAIGYIVAEGMV